MSDTVKLKCQTPNRRISFSMADRDGLGTAVPRLSLVVGLPVEGQFEVMNSTRMPSGSIM